jgi:membrane protease YdiL (CAAX protease family)
VFILKFTEKSLWGSVFLICVVAPLTEESLFRGLLLRGFLRRDTRPGRPPSPRPCSSH